MMIAGNSQVIDVVNSILSPDSFRHAGHQQSREAAQGAVVVQWGVEGEVVVEAAPGLWSSRPLGGSHFLPQSPVLPKVVGLFVSGHLGNPGACPIGHAHYESVHKNLWFD